MKEPTESFEFDIPGRRRAHPQERRKDIENTVVKGPLLRQSLLEDFHSPQKLCEVNEESRHNVVVRRHLLASLPQVQSVPDRSARAHKAGMMLTVNM